MTEPTTREVAQLRPLQDGFDKPTRSTDLLSMTRTSESLTHGHDVDPDYQAMEPSVAEKPRARLFPSEGGIKTQPIVESVSGMDDASDTDDNHDSKDQWEYKRIVNRWEQPHGPKKVKLEWAKSVVRAKEMEGLAKVLAKYETRNINRWEDPHGCKWVDLVWMDSWVAEKDVKGLAEALAEYEKGKPNRRKRKNNIRKGRHQ